MASLELPREELAPLERTKTYGLRLEMTKSYFKENGVNDLVAAISEFLGTVTFLFLGLGGISAAASSVTYRAGTAAGQTTEVVDGVASIQQLMFDATSMGLALLGSAWIFFRVTGSAFNPNISLALFLCKVISFPRFVLYVFAQFLGAIVACAILEGVLPGRLAVTPALGAGTTAAQGVWIEAFITAAFCLSVLMLAVEKHRGTFAAPIGIALTLFSCHLASVIYTGCGMNVARAFGPSVISGFNSDHWIYWVGDGIGTLMATTLYLAMKWFRYSRLNPDSDADEIHAPTSPALFAPATRTNASILPTTVQDAQHRPQSSSGSDARTLASPVQQHQFEKPSEKQAMREVV